MGIDIKGLFKKKNALPLIDISSVNIMWNSSFHTLPGIKSTETVFEVKVPFANNNTVNELVKSIFKAGEGEIITIKEVSVYKPFELVSIEPNLPININPNQKVEFTLKISGPKQNYSGPLSIKLVPVEYEKVKIEINKTRIIYNGKATDIDKSEMILTLPKGQIFKNTVQMYKALSYGAIVSKVSLNNPFKLISTVPKLPFKIDDNNSYLATFYIAAPDSNYAGPLELTVS